MRALKFCAALALFASLGVFSANVDIGPVTAGTLQAQGAPQWAIDGVYDAAGNLYVTHHHHHLISKIAPGQHNAVAVIGNGVGGSTNGVGTAATVYGPMGIILNNAGELAWVEQSGHRIRKATFPTFEVTTHVGNGLNNAHMVSTAPLASAQVPVPNKLVQDPTTGDYYVVCHYGLLLRFTTVEMTTVAGTRGPTGSVVGFQDGTGEGNTKFDEPMGLGMRAADGNIYVADSVNCRLRLVTTPGGVVTTVVGSSTCGAADGVGAAAQVNIPYDVQVMPDGVTAYVADRIGHSLRRVNLATFAVDTVVGSTHEDSWTSNAVSYLATMREAYGVALSHDHTTLAVTGLFGVSTISLVPPCSCPLSLTADYTTLHVPVATNDATSAITLNEATWEVTFTVSNVLSMTNGHVIAGSVDPQQTAATAFTPLVSSFANVWNPPSDCTIGALDTPATSLGIAVSYDASNCKKSYTVKYSLIDTTKQNSHCQLVDAGGNIKVSCALVLTSVRAYDATAPTAFLSHATTFTSEMTLPKTIVDQHGSQLYATVAKCSVRNAPSHQVECRIPGLWSFDPSFVISQAPALWIVASSCAQSQAGGATFLTCNLNSSAPVQTVQTASAVIRATVAGTSPADTMSFNVEYTVPRLLTTSASASLQNFVTNIAMADGKFYYGTADTALLQIDVVDTSRLTITNLEFFNNATPVQTYALRAEAQFQVVESSTATRFTVQFLPSAILQDSAFYKNGPHGVRVTFAFTSARRAEGGAQDGEVTVRGMQVDTPAESQRGGSSSSSSTSEEVLPWAIGASVGVLAVGLIGAAVVVRRRRLAAGASEEKAASSSVEAPAEMCGVADLDHAAVTVE